MTTDNMAWVENVPAGESKFFKLVEGDNRVQLLSYLSRYLLRWNGNRYEPAEEGDQNISVKGVGYVLQEGVIKEATLPYTVVKAIRELMNDPDYTFEQFPMPRQINIKTKNAGTKEAEYTVIPAPKETEVSQTILDELDKKPTPDELVEQMRVKEKAAISPSKSSGIEYPEEELNPADVPF